MNTFCIKILSKLRILKWINVSGKIQLNGKEFEVPILGAEGFGNLYMTEPWMIDLLKVVLPIEGKRFIDVGVNVGQTLLKLKSVSEDIAYIGFEPNPRCVNYARALIETNGFVNVDLVPVGISDGTNLGRLDYYTHGDTDSSASVIPDFRPDQAVVRSEYVPLFDFDDLTATLGLDSISILKIDVEGGELEVIKSLRNEIAKHQPVILLEVLPVYKEENTSRLSRQEEIHVILDELGYAWFRVKKADDELKGFEMIRRIGIHSDMNACEYVVIPRSKTDVFIGRAEKADLQVELVTRSADARY
mgnify:CR=1 FL=1